MTSAIPVRRSVNGVMKPREAGQMRVQFILAIRRELHDVYMISAVQLYDLYHMSNKECGY